MHFSDMEDWIKHEGFLRHGTSGTTSPIGQEVLNAHCGYRLATSACLKRKAQNVQK